MDGVDVSDLKLYPDKMRQLLRDRTGPVGKDLEKRTKQVEQTAKRLAPVLTGKFRDSITHEIKQDSDGLVGVVSSDDEKALAVEFGTTDTDAQPTLRPALRRRQ